MLNFSILKTQSELLQWRQEQKSEVGFVPTMGGLHHGHCQLIKAAQSSNSQKKSKVLVSVFVNPLQFGPTEDFKSYPRNLQNDIEIARKAGANAIWAPSTNQIFKGGKDSIFRIQVPEKLQSRLCGAKRIGHFDGVATVIIHLLKNVQPNFLVLGEKDWQQYVIIRELIKALGLPIQVRGVATIRAQDGLPYSSRNQYLSQSERVQSLALPRELLKAANNFKQGKILDLKKTRSSLEQEGLNVEYLEVVNPHNLQPAKPSENYSLLAASVRCGTTRLIDHTFLMTRKPIIAIDGPAGAGKSTVTRAFAERLGLLYLDTGAMYRAVAWLIEQTGVDPKDQNKIRKVLEKLSLVLKPTKTTTKVIINGNEVTEAIRSPSVTSIVSLVATQPLVREALTTQQKAMGESGGLVAEGRDIGTAVFPDAELKIFLTASTTERARRRMIDLQNQGFAKPDFDNLKQEIKERDHMDKSRSLSPLIKAKDAKELVTDGMNIEQVIEVIEQLFREKVPEEVWPTPSN